MPVPTIEPVPFQRAARRAAVAVAALIAASCSDRSSTVTGLRADDSRFAVSSAPLPALIEEPVLITVPTYENSGEAVHPDVVEFPNGWNGRKYWLTLTPYPKSDSKVENPSILTSDDGRSVAVPTGLVNPVIPHRGRAGDYNSDPELVYEPETDRLLLFYRFVDKRTNTILVSSSKDGLTWKAEPKAFWTRTHAAVSPTIAPRNGDITARMWYVDAGKAGCKTQASRVMTRSAVEPTGKLAGVKWAEPIATDLAVPGHVIWHMKARYVPSKQEYWALLVAFPTAPAGCDVDDLYFARSTDGVHWTTYSEPILRHEDRAWTAAAIYRSSFLYDPATDELRVWLSARGDDAKWRIGLARFRYSRLVPELTGDSRGPRSASSRIAIGTSEDEP